MYRYIATGTQDSTVIWAVERERLRQALGWLQMKYRLNGWTSWGGGRQIPRATAAALCRRQKQKAPRVLVLTGWISFAVEEWGVLHPGKEWR